MNSFLVAKVEKSVSFVEVIAGDLFFFKNKLRDDGSMVSLPEIGNAGLPRSDFWFKWSPVHIAI